MPPLKEQGRCLCADMEGLTRYTVYLHLCKKIHIYIYAYKYIEHIPRKLCSKLVTVVAFGRVTRWLRAKGERESFFFLFGLNKLFY